MVELGLPARVGRVLGQPPEEVSQGVPGRMELELRSPRRPATDGAVRVLLLGDFSGRGGIGVEAPATSRPFVRVAPESFDDALAAVAPRLPVEVAEPHGLFEPRRLEDFHPDELLRQPPGLTG